MKARRKISLSSTSGLDEHAQALRGDLEDTRRTPRGAVEDRRTTGQEVDVAREPSLFVDRHDLVRGREAGDLPLDDEEQAEPISLLPEGVTIRKRALEGERNDPRDLRLGQCREDPILARNRRGPRSHGSALQINGHRPASFQVASTRSR